MARTKRTKQFKKRTAKESEIGFADALLEIYTTLKFSPSERRSYLEQVNVLWNRLQNRRRFIQYHQYFFDEAEENRVSTFKIGRYLAERLKSKELPKLSRSYNPWVGE